MENNVKVVLQTLLGLFVPKTIASPMEALYTRKCVAYVLVTTLGRRMGEKGRLDAVRVRRWPTVRIPHACVCASYAWARRPWAPRV